MAENQVNKPVRDKDDDIDLGKAFTGIGSFFKRSLRGLINFIAELANTFIRKIKIVAGLTIIGLAAGAGYFFLKKPFYGTTLTLYSEYFYGELLDNSIKNLDALCDEKNYDILSKRLNIPEPEARQLKGFRVQNIIPNKYKNLIEFYKKDEKGKRKLDSLLLYNSETMYQVYMEVYDTSVVMGFDSVLIKYITDNEYVQKRMEIDRKNNEQLKQKINTELIKLDTLKGTVYRNIATIAERARAGSNNIILADQNTTNPLDLFREDINLYRQGLALDRRLFLDDKIEIIEEFIPFSSPKSGTVKRNMAIGGLAGISLAFIMIFFIAVKRVNES